MLLDATGSAESRNPDWHLDIVGAESDLNAGAISEARRSRLDIAGRQRSP